MTWQVFIDTLTDFSKLLEGVIAQADNLNTVPLNLGPPTSGKTQILERFMERTGHEFVDLTNRPPGHRNRYAKKKKRTDLENVNWKKEGF